MQASACNFIKKETMVQVLSCEFCQNTFLYRTTLGDCFCSKHVKDASQKQFTFPGANPQSSFFQSVRCWIFIFTLLFLTNMAFSWHIHLHLWKWKNYINIRIVVKLRFPFVHKLGTFNVIRTRTLILAKD